MEANDETMVEGRHIVQVYVGAVSQQYEALSIEVSKNTPAQEIVGCIVDKLGLNNPNNFYLAEVVHNGIGEECKERRLGLSETPVGLQRLWPQNSAEGQAIEDRHEYKFCLREKNGISEPSPFESQIIRDYFKRFLYSQHKDKEYPDLCLLSNLTEETLLHNLKVRFNNGQIYTYVGSILISVNPFKYYPIYNPKYVKLYQNHRLGELPPHIFAIADCAYHSMVKQRRNQCIVISGESGSGKTESTLFLLHHLTMLSQKGSHGSGVEQIILSSGPVLEAFGNAKTRHNNNSSRFGKFIQVSYKENGLVQGARVQKYLLEKSRICSQAYNERSYHVFYYLLAGASPQERTELNLLRPKEYNYLNQSKCYTIEGCDEQFEFLRLKQSMEMVGFTAAKQHRLFSVLSAVLLLGNVEFQQSRVAYHHHDESVSVRNTEVVASIAHLLGVSEATLVSALTAKKARVQGETIVIHYRRPEAVVARDTLAKCLYGALFDWIVLQLNYSLLSLKDHKTEESANSIGVLDIFGFEDFANQNRFEQFCINYANERLQHYFNQHVFEYEQEEYQREGIAWTHIEFQDNIDCLALIEDKPTGLLCILDDQCNFPGATNETFLQKINSVHKDNPFYEVPAKRENAFVILHYAGPVKYQVNDIREKNLDLMRPELITVLKHSQFCIVRELAGADPVAVFRWAILRAFFRAANAFRSNREDAVSRREGDNRGSQRVPISKVTIEHAKIQAAIENTQNRLRKTRYTRAGSGPLSGRSSRYRSHHGSASGWGRHHNKNLQTVKALAMRTQGRSGGGGRKMPHTVTGQFQMSLQALMETLNRANPYFIRCIKSNANKEANVFDDDLVMRQLRYTGMLETVRIRQAGFNVRMTYEEFIQHYRILLPKGLLSSQSDVKNFLSSSSLQLELTEHQEGKTRVFMRESQKEKLDTLMHHTILKKILVIQRWYRAKRQRKLFVRIRCAVLRIQCHIRKWLAEQELARLQLNHRAAVCIQRIWRGYRQRRVYMALRRAVIGVQSAYRGAQARKRFKERSSRAAKERPSTQHTLLSNDSMGTCSLTTLTSNLTISGENLSQSSTLPHHLLPSDNMTEKIHSGEPLPSTDSSNLMGRKFSVDTALLSVKQSENLLQEHDDKMLNRTLSDPAANTQNQFYDVTQQQMLPGASTFVRNTEQPFRRKERSSISPDESISHYKEKNSSHNLQRKPGDSSVETKDQDARQDVESSESTDVQLRKEPTRRLVSSSDVVLGEDPPPFQQPPPRRRSAANIPKHAVAASTQAPFPPRRQSEQWRAGRLGPADSSPPSASSPLLPHRQKTGSFRHRLYPKLRPPSPSEQGEDGPVPDSEDSGSINFLSRPPPLSNRESSNISGPSKQKYNFKKTFKNIMGSKPSSSREAVYATDEDNSSLSCDSSVPPTPTLEHACPHYSEAPYGSEEMQMISDSDSTANQSAADLAKNQSNQPLSQQDIKRIIAASPHTLKQSQLRKGDTCASCAKTFTNFFIKQGYKCIVCRMVFHQRCIEKCVSIPCHGTSNAPPTSSSSSQQPSPSLIQKANAKKHNLNETENSWNLTGTSQFIDKSVEVVRDTQELHAFDQFLTRKLFDLQVQPGPSLSVSNDQPQDNRKDSQVDQLFMSSLRGFKEELLSQYSVAVAADNPDLGCIKYKDLVNTFERIMTTVTKQQGGGGGSTNTFPITMGVNAFRGFIDEYQREAKRDRGPGVGGAGGRKRRRNRRKKKEKKPVEEIAHGQHRFTNIMVNIPTLCEVCNSFLWLSVKALTCNKCKLTCHEKCLGKVPVTCPPPSSKSVVVVSSSPSKGKGAASAQQIENIGKVFGVSLERQEMVSGLPLVVDRLLTHIERGGLFTEGLYRKSAATSKVREVKALIEEDINSVPYTELPVHVLTTLLKTFLRELPEPLLTFDAYDPLLHASLLPDPEEQCITALRIIDSLPSLNFTLVERLFFHLARVAHQEEHNRMNSNSLAIVFSPCIVRSTRSLPVHESLSEVSKLTQVIERVISRRLIDFRTTLAQIDSVDSKTADAGAKLDLIRQKKEEGRAISATAEGGSPPRPDPRLALQEYKLEEELVTLSEDRERLALELRDMMGGGSSEEELIGPDDYQSERGSLREDRRKDSTYRYLSSSSNFPSQGPAPGRRKQTLSRQLSEDPNTGGSRGYRGAGASTGRRLRRLPSSGEFTLDGGTEGDNDSEDSVMV